MALRPGQLLSHYRLVEKIGKGDMGVLWKAEDTVLGRHVAIKLLPDDLAHDPERLARFKREARLLASLNHPNIASIYGLAQADGVQFLVLELVEGPTLAERVAHGPLSIHEVLSVCLQIAEALGAAHEKGVIHRDLKPGNVKITPEDRVKVLDFGLAKTLPPPESASGITQDPTKILSQTSEGVILGTTSYMSPEQARGKPLDKRTDIWSFGCVLYEALTGMRAFSGETSSDTLAKVLVVEPQWRTLPAQTPAKIRQLVRDCLRKDGTERTQDFGDVRGQLAEALATLSDAGPGALSGTPGRAPWTRLAVWGCLAVLAIAGSASLWVSWHPNQHATRPVVKFQLRLPSEVTFPSSEGGNSYSLLAVAPDGSRLVYVAEREDRTQLYLRAIDQLRTEPIPGTEGGANPFFSPDGRWIGFFADGKLKKVPASGGPAVDLCDAPWTLGASWGPDGTIVFGVPGAGLWRVSEAGGVAKTLTEPDRKSGEVFHHSPQILPDGENVLFTISYGTEFDQRVAVQSLDGGEPRRVLEDAGSALYVPSGHLVFMRAGRLNASRFDLARLQPIGLSVPILEDLGIGVFLHAAQMAFSNDGLLVYLSESSTRSIRQLFWVDRKGHTSAAAQLRRVFLEPSLSPDGRRLAVTINTERFGLDVWVSDLDRGSWTQLTADGRNAWPIWTPDGRRVTFASNRAGHWNLYWMPADGSAPAERLTTSAYNQNPTSWSPDGKILLFTESSTETSDDLWVLPRDGERTPRLFLRTPAFEAGARFSPDGRWVAFYSDESGQEEVYVCQYPTCESRSRLSTGGGADPIWAPDGRDLFYRNKDQVLAVSVETEGMYKAGAPRVLFKGRFDASASHGNYHIHPDGQRFVMIRNEPTANPAELNVVLNWFEELNRSVPAQTE